MDETTREEVLGRQRAQSFDLTEGETHFLRFAYFNSWASARGWERIPPGSGASLPPSRRAHVAILGCANRAVLSYVWSTETEPG